VATADPVGQGLDRRDGGCVPRAPETQVTSAALARKAGEVRLGLGLADLLTVVALLVPATRAAGAALTVSDLNAPMLDIARAKLAGRAGAEAVVADAMALPFADASMDLIVCQFGVMFFPDKPASFREAARVLAPGGRYLFNTWGTTAENPFSEVASEVSAAAFPDDPPGFYRVPFSYPDPAAVRADLAAGGFGEVEHRRVAFEAEVADPARFARGIVYGNPL